MASLSLLTQAFTVKHCSPEDLAKACAENLGVPAASINLFALVPFAQAPQSTAVAFTVKGNSFALSTIEDLLVQREQLKQQLQQTKDALDSCTTDQGNTQRTIRRERVGTRKWQ